MKDEDCEDELTTAGDDATEDCERDVCVDGGPKRRANEQVEKDDGIDNETDEGQDDKNWDVENRDEASQKM